MMLSSRLWSLSPSPIAAAVKPLFFTTTAVQFKKRKHARIHWPNDWLPFEWDYPPREPGFFVTGDPKEKLLEVEDFDNIYKPGFEFLKDRDDVPESVKKLYRMKNSYRMELSNFIRAKRNEKYKRHPFDEESHEVMIANYTSKIRNHQEIVRDNPNQVISKILITLFATKRTRRLNELWRMDSDRYHALVKDLGIDHELGVSGVPGYGKIMRKKSLRELTQAYCHNIKKAKLEAYEEKLKSQQQPFMKKKEETLKWIEDEMRKYHITEDDLRTGFIPRLKFRDPHPVRPLVSQIE